MAASQGDPMEQLRALLVVLEQVQAVRYADVACTTLGAWEYMLSFSSELKYVWSMPWSAVKGISFFIRYSFLPFMIISLYESNGIATHSDRFCKIWGGINSFWTFFVYASVHWLVLLRVYAYYGRNKKLFWILSSLWGLAFCVTVTELILFLHEIMPSLVFEPTLKLCVSSVPPWLPAIHCAFLIVEIPLLIMIIHKYRHDIQHTFHSTLINRFIQDGVGYFFIVFGLIMWNVFFGLFAPPVYSAIPRHWSTVILTICANRLVMNLRRAGEKSNLSHRLQGSDTPNPGGSGTGQTWSGKKSAVSDTARLPVLAGHQYGGLKGPAVGAAPTYNVIEIAPTQRREMDTMTTTNGDIRHPYSARSGNPYV